MKNNKGFTLVELLVVIAIIGILSTVAVVNLNAARKKAKFAVVKQSFSDIRPAILTCLYDGMDLNSNAGNCSPPFTGVSAGVSICNGSDAVWPELPDGFSGMYCNVGSVSNVIFSYGAQYEPPLGDTVTCNNNGCI
jgi:prepilin-type N-terminal cleavage/methylation domain-containing protein